MKEMKLASNFFANMEVVYQLEAGVGLSITLELL